MLYSRYRFHILLLVGSFINSCNAQENSGENRLLLEKTIALPGVNGRIDHIDINVKDKIAYIVALDNNTLEIVDLKSGRITGTIKRLHEPQGVAYIEKHKKFMVANGGSGECSFYNAATLKKTGSIKLSGDADNVRVDKSEDKIYVGYGNGGIAIIDASSHMQIDDIILPSHPESFQLDVNTARLWVNLPGSGMIGLVNLKKTRLIAHWSRFLPRANFPMAYDELQHRILVGYRLPSRLIIYDSETGKEIFSSPTVGDVDDLYWNKTTGEIYLSGGSGAINIFKQTGKASYKQLFAIKIPIGARTSLFVPELNQFLIAARSIGDQPAKLIIYRVLH